MTANNKCPSCKRESFFLNAKPPEGQDLDDLYDSLACEIKGGVKKEDAEFDEAQVNVNRDETSTESKK